MVGVTVPLCLIKLPIELPHCERLTRILNALRHVSVENIKINNVIIYDEVENVGFEETLFFFNITLM